MQTIVKKKDLTIQFEMKMSEAQFIVDALAGVKFKADNLINKIVDQVNPQLPKPTPGQDATTDHQDDELPIGISNEIDEKIIALFSEAWNKDAEKVHFDFVTDKKKVIVDVEEGIENGILDALNVSIGKMFLPEVNASRNDGVKTKDGRSVIRYIFQLVEPGAKPKKSK